MEVFFASEAFKSIILFSGRFANKSISEHNWKEVYGFLVGKIVNRNGKECLFIQNMVPMIHGEKTEVYFNEDDYSLSETIIEEICNLGLFICGWYHTHPGFGLFLSKTDIINQLGFQSAFNDSVAVVFDFKKLTDTNNGLKVFRLSDISKGVDSAFEEVPYQIDTSESNQSFIGRSLADISMKYSEGEPSYLIKEAAELLKDSGDIKDLLGDLDENTNILEKISLEDLEPVNFEDLEPINLGDLEPIPKKFHSLPTLEDLELIPLKKDYNPNDGNGYYELTRNYSENDSEIRALRERINYANDNEEPTGYFMIKLANILIEKSLSTNEALNYLESAEDEFKATEDSWGLAITRNELGLFYEERGDFMTALNNFESSLKLLEELDDSVSQIKIINNIGNVYLKMKEYDTAFSNYKKAYNISRSINFQFGIISSLNNTIDVLLFLHNYKLANDVLKGNLDYFTRTGNNFGISITYSKFGKLYYAQGQNYYDLSMKFFENAVEIKTSGGYHKEMIDDLIFIAKIHSESGSVNLAENFLLQGLNTARTFDLSEREGEIYNLLGEIFELSENFDEMNNYYNLALENYKDFGKDEKIVELIEKLAKIELKYFNNNEKSLHLEHDVLDIYRNQGYQKMVAETLLRISDIHLDLGDEKSAIECLTEARHIYEDLLDEFTAELIKEKLNSLKQLE